jgi:hypothetical protein
MALSLKTAKPLALKADPQAGRRSLPASQILSLMPTMGLLGFPVTGLEEPRKPQSGERSEAEGHREEWGLP